MGLSNRKLHIPHFICVGPEKTGTTWLYHNLASHPDIFLPPMKELRYFYEIHAYPDESWQQRLSSKGDWHSMRYRQYLSERLKYYSRHPWALLRERHRLGWDWRFLFGTRNDEWYLSMFNLADGEFTGEISPQYFFLPESQITHMQQLLPKLKVIILLRNPIDWCWSFARMTILNKRQLSEIPQSQIFEFFEEKIKRNKFAPAIKRWQEHFPSEQLYIGFYDKLNEKPLEMHGEICKFLEIDQQRTPERILNGLSKRINKGQSLSLPDDFARHLAYGWKEDVEELSRLFSPYPQKWKINFDELTATQ